ncbi:hypothetical protein ABFX02_14G302200 [Erythranthe guttata]
MDKRSWPWKKKSSNSSALDKVKHDSENEKPKFIQIPTESYANLTGLVDQVKSYEEQVRNLEEEVKELNGKLSEAHSEMTDKENVVKQHAKVAEEAISGWEKAEAEAATLKTQVESVTLLKLTAEDRGTHLDGALKECMRQIRDLKEEHSKKLQEVIHNKTKLFDKMKLDLESKISDLEQELCNSADENAALSTSLRDCSNMLTQLGEEKSEAESEIRLLNSNIESYEKEVSSLKYEVHIARKEVEIRNEEKNMSVRSAELANKQHIEGAKKIAKLEAECQRLRGLVRKKLPGPAALAQMKLEVEHMGRDYAESRLRKSHLPEFSFDNSLKIHKEHEQLTERMLSMDEETRMLKEALAKRNGELEASRSLYEETAVKLRSLEAELRGNGERLSSRKGIEDGNDDNVSCADSWATMSISAEHSYVCKEKNLDSPHISEKSSRLCLMDDFLEMEKFANETDPKTVESLSEDVKSCMDSVQTINQELEIAISYICDIVKMLGKEAETSADRDELNEEIDTFSAKYNEAINSKMVNLVEFVLDISRVLSKANELHLNVTGFKSCEVENSSSDCIDKIVLPENKALLEDSSGERYPNSCSQFSDSASDPDIPSDAKLVPTSESPWKCSFEEFEQLKADLAISTANLESTKSQLLETEQLLADVKLQLTSAQKSNTLAETQVKCMAESYRSLETRAEELQTEINSLQTKIENMDNELQKEKASHQDALTRCNDLLEQLQRVDNSSATVDNIDKASQVRPVKEAELAAASEKLAECQETIFLLGKQLKSLRPQTDIQNSTTNSGEQPTISGMNFQPTIDFGATSFSLHRAGSESFLDPFNSQFSTSDSEANKPPIRSKHRPTKSGSCSASPTPSEKQSRGFSRFFSSKGKNSY